MAARGRPRSAPPKVAVPEGVRAGSPEPLDSRYPWLPGGASYEAVERPGSPPRDYSRPNSRHGRASRPQSAVAAVARSPVTLQLGKRSGSPGAEPDGPRPATSPARMPH